MKLTGKYCDDRRTVRRNHFLAVRRNEWKANKVSINYTKSNQLLTDLKRREETAWLNEVDFMALQESLRNLDRAYTISAVQVKAQTQPVLPDAQPVRRHPHDRKPDQATKDRPCENQAEPVF